MPLDARKHYLIRATNGASVMCWRGQESPKLVSGGARYDVVERPRRKSTVQWGGDDPYRMDVPVLLDGWISHTSIEHDVALLNNMMQSPGGMVPPVRVFVDGALPVKGGTWVVEGIDWGDQVIWSNDSVSKTGEYHTTGYRLRQDAIIHLLQHVEPKVLQVNAPNTGYPIIVKANQTLDMIARDFNIAVEAIMAANNLRDKKAIKPQQRLIVPANLWDLGIKPIK